MKKFGLEAQLVDKVDSVINNNFSNVFKQTLEKINNKNNNANPRGLKVKESLLETMELNPIYPIAHFRSRPFNWKYFAGELAWYLKKDRDINYINNFSSFWKGITNPGTNKINSNYGALVLNEQLEWVINSLIKDKDSRQAIAFFNRPEFQFENNKDFVCTLYANFFIRDNKLHMKVQMRSNDMFYGLTFDAPFFSFLHQTVWRCVWEARVHKGEDEHLELGNYYHCADNLHFYERHFDLADKIIKSTAKNKNYSLKLKDSFFKFENGKLKYTEKALDYIDDIDSVLNKNLKMESYKNILSNYFVL
tara:strand:+ start:6000 stop:6917 length:918 start_codon:yes stop_codon:yes gene_type:complete